MLKGITYPTATYLNGKIFVGSRGGKYSTSLACFSLEFGVWGRISLYDGRERMTSFTLTTVMNQVLVISGRWRKGKIDTVATNEVLSLSSELEWDIIFPPLITGRLDAASISFEDYVVVAGGTDKNLRLLASVEVLKASNPFSSWFEICPFPLKSWYMKCTVTNELLVLGLCEGIEASDLDVEKTLYAAKLSDIRSIVSSQGVNQESEQDPKLKSIWNPFPKTPLKQSGLVFANDSIVAVGGCDDSEAEKTDVYLFDHYAHHWTHVGNITEARWKPSVVTVHCGHRQQMFVIGGCRNSHEPLKTVESCEF